MAEKSNEGTRRLKVTIHGAVQGVGFRPFIYRIAGELQLPGWISNTSQGVHIEVEGSHDALQQFLSKIYSEKPPLACIQSCESTFLDPKGFTTFEIKESSEEGIKTALILPDIATCPDCLKDIFDKTNRRYLYPFTNCTNCGPRYTIIQALPYDRKNTTMHQFTMCEECEKEYHDPTNRRFHAQPNACPKCGPHVELWDPNGERIAQRHDAILQTVAAILQGKIVAVKGLGGFHLMCDAQSNEAVQLLRKRKHREEKPFALMFPTFDDVERECEVSKVEKHLLLSPESPIILLKRKSETDRTHSAINNPKSAIASSVAPNNPFLGVMLPYTPLHHILMSLLQSPVIATSGNISEEPICTNEQQALKKLHSIADYFLVHNRPIERYCDDSIVRTVEGRELVMRRARGYAPLPVQIPLTLESPILAVGGHLKNTVAVARGTSIFVSQHIGDLETAESFTSFKKTIDDLTSLYEITPFTIVHDAHPHYASTTYALNGQAKKDALTKTISLQHHYAHIASCMAENELTGTVLGFAWDGTGYGTDGTIWGAECILADNNTFRRVGTIHSFKLPGGDVAAREPRRCAASILYELFGGGCFEHSVAVRESFSEKERTLIKDMLKKNINSPFTTSMGRLFDAVAAILGLRMKSSFEGQAAMEVEFLAFQSTTDETYPSIITEENNLFRWDWKEMFKKILADVASNVPKADIAKKFHNTLSLLIIEMAKKMNVQQVVLSGGCFQNILLLEKTISALRVNGFSPYWHQRIPTNDGGISLGQIYSIVLSNAGNKKFAPSYVQSKESVMPAKAGIQ
ncbi:MAG: carbamoyltransferase HypF [Bacteroidota bacterium]|nr:carbamoyltransferase HypF [Bacteroidota bacterium]